MWSILYIQSFHAMFAEQYCNRKEKTFKQNFKRGMKVMITHTYAICAYKESKYLEECIQSIKNQTVPSEILIATSTPNDFIKKLSEKYKIPLYINEGEKGITQDWNFAYKKATTDLVTIAHQDDIYLSHYTSQIMKLEQKAIEPLILFTDYAELRNEKIVVDNKLLRVKRIMLWPLRFSKIWNSKFVRRRILSFGCPICCPAVTFVKANLPEIIFRAGFRSDEDWEAWEILSKMRGAFVYSREIGMYHRIHEESETSVILGDNARSKEDLVMFSKFWPKRIAKLLSKIYSSAEESNEL